MSLNTCRVEVPRDWLELARLRGGQKFFYAPYEN